MTNQQINHTDEQEINSSDFKFIYVEPVEIEILPEILENDIFTRATDVVNAYNISKQHVLIVGLGSTGSNIAVNLQKIGVREFTLYDPDYISVHNTPSGIFKYEKTIDRLTQGYNSKYVYASTTTNTNDCLFINPLFKADYVLRELYEFDHTVIVNARKKQYRFREANTLIKELSTFAVKLSEIENLVFKTMEYKRTKITDEQYYASNYNPDLEYKLVRNTDTYNPFMYDAVENNILVNIPHHSLNLPYNELVERCKYRMDKELDDIMDMQLDNTPNVVIVAVDSLKSRYEIVKRLFQLYYDVEHDTMTPIVLIDIGVANALVGQVYVVDLANKIMVADYLNQYVNQKVFKPDTLRLNIINFDTSDKRIISTNNNNACNNQISNISGVVSSVLVNSVMIKLFANKLMYDINNVKNTILFDMNKIEITATDYLLKEVN